MHLHTDEIAAAVGGMHHGPVVEVRGAAIDSRLVRGGELFVPIVAERDGHDFIADALQSGAVAYLTERTPSEQGHAIVDGTAIVVPSTLRALADLGRQARRRLPDLVVGVTGSVGKTTVKDLTAGALSVTFRTAASERSFNNEMGVPLTLLNAADDVEAVVVEMGARGLGHISLLCDIAQPTIGVVTVVTLAHGEMFGTIEQVASAKGELVEALPASGTAVLNADDPRVAAMADRTKATVVRYGVTALEADVRAEAIVVDDELRVSFRLRSAWGDAGVRLGMRGAHQVGNALAASAAALAAGVPPEAIAHGLETAVGSPWRMEVARTASGAVILNDAYNANPLSMTAALDALNALPATRRIAVLGTMAELGPQSASEHRRIAAHAASLGIIVLAVGTDDYGVDDVDDVDAALVQLGSLRAGDAVLIKGSRVAGLERLAQALLS